MICRFTSSLREISSESNVMLYYVRGDHDHDMTKALARELFGENVSLLNLLRFYLFQIVKLPLKLGILYSAVCALNQTMSDRTPSV